MGTWREVGGTVKTNSDNSVTIQVLIDKNNDGDVNDTDDVAATATDRGACGVPPYTASGRIGLRSDNVNMNVDNLSVTSFP